MTAAFADPHEAAAYAAYRQEQEAEYGMWVAAQDIMVGAVLGFTKGMSVPASTVAAQGWDTAGLVEMAPKTGAQRAEQLRARREALAAEQAAIDAELEQSVGESDPTPGEYAKWKVHQLQAELDRRGLDSEGLKPVLVARLKDDDEDRED